MLQEYTWASVYNISVRSTSKHSDCGLWLLKVSLHMHKYETHIENAPQKKLTWEPPKKKTKKHGNGLNGSHTDLSQTLSQREPRKNKKKCFQVSPFHTPHILSAVTDLFRVEKRQEIQKGPKIRVWRAFRGKVQVCHFSCASQYKNATRTLLLSTTQVRGRPNPLQFAKFFKKGAWKLAGQLARQCSFHCTEFSSPALCLLSLSTRGKKEEQLWESAILCLFSVMSEESSPLCTQNCHSSLSFL